MKTKSLEELTDEFIGPLGSMKRDAFEKELRLDILGAQIRQIRKDRNLTQEQLGDLIGVKKAQISKIENSLRQVRFDTIIKVFDALNAKLFFRVEVD